ncbi:MAG: PDZ domain-containing protein [Actinobacteria bacterium]|nr:PDZ domain-containing protein [Actinomycetota bacterium]
MRKSIFMILCLTSLILIVCLASSVSTGCGSKTKTKDEEEVWETQVLVVGTKLVAATNPLPCVDETEVTATIDFKVKHYDTTENTDQTVTIMATLYDSDGPFNFDDPLASSDNFTMKPKKWVPGSGGRNYDRAMGTTFVFKIHCTDTPDCYVEGDLESSGERTAELYVYPQIFKNGAGGAAVEGWENHKKIIDFTCAVCDEDDEGGVSDTAGLDEVYEEEKTIGGIGIGISHNEEGKIVVAVLLNNYPAHTGGIELGDHILSVDEKDVEGKDLESVQKDIIGLINTEVKIKYYDVSEGKIKEVSIMRVPTSTEIIVDEASGEEHTDEPSSEEEPTEEPPPAQEEEICPKCKVPYSECGCTPPTDN